MVYILKDKIRKRWSLCISGIFLIALFLRLYHLGFHDLWYDEIAIFEASSYGWNNNDFKFYLLFIHLWLKIFGFSELKIRFPSMIFSFLSVILIYFLAKALFNHKIVSIASSFFMAFSPFHLWYAQEACNYGMFLFFSMLSSYLFLKVTIQEKIQFWIYLLIISIITFYTNYFYIFLFFAQFVYLIYVKRLKINFKHTVYFLITILFIFLFSQGFFKKFYLVKMGFWVPKPNVYSLIITLENFLLGYNGSFGLYIISDILIAIMLAFGVANITRKELRKPLLFCLILFFVPLVSVFFFSRILFSIYLDRALIIFTPYFYIILSLGLISLNKKIISFLGGFLLILFLIGDYRYFHDYIYPPIEHHIGTHVKRPIKPIVKFLKDNLKPNDIIVFTESSMGKSLRFYLSRDYFTFRDHYFFDPYLLSDVYYRPLSESIKTQKVVSIYNINKLQFEKMWVIFSNWPRDGTLNKHSQAVKYYLDKNFKQESIKEFWGTWVACYRKKES